MFTYIVYNRTEEKGDLFVVFFVFSPLVVSTNPDDVQVNNSQTYISNINVIKCTSLYCHSTVYIFNVAITIVDITVHVFIYVIYSVSHHLHVVDAHVHYYIMS